MTGLSVRGHLSLSSTPVCPTTGVGFSLKVRISRIMIRFPLLPLLLQIIYFCCYQWGIGFISALRSCMSILSAEAIPWAGLAYTLKRWQNLAGQKPMAKTAGRLALSVKSHSCQSLKIFYFCFLFCVVNLATLACNSTTCFFNWSVSTEVICSEQAHTLCSWDHTRCLGPTEGCLLTQRCFFMCISLFACLSSSVCSKMRSSAKEGVHFFFCSSCRSVIKVSFQQPLQNCFNRTRTDQLKPLLFAVCRTIWGLWLTV